MENENKGRREARDELCRAIELLIDTDPNAPSEIRAGMKVAQAVRALHETANELIDLCRELVDAGDVGHLRELEQYAKLVTQGIRQYLAAINYRPKTGGET
jgi:hypothetical protein